MIADNPSIVRIPCYCALCVSRCGATAVIENGRFVALEPDPSYPTGKALCAKGRAAPELVYHPDRLLYPLKRTRPKGEPDPGWERISWDEALDLTAARLATIAREHGPESVVFVEALERGARLIVVDPRRTGPANKSDIWLQVRPGTDAALALGIAHVMIERGWYDRDFIRDWTNGPLLVRTNNGRLLTHADLSRRGSAKHYVAWGEMMGGPKAASERGPG